tara:strand:- start:6396 stop:7346 length:951 start_codon:yes stop_codon:yes gene_type:complete
MILITGSSGYIGSHLSTYFDKKKVKYIGCDNLSFSYRINISDKKKHFITDIGNRNKIEKLIKKNKINTVIHCAASSYVLDVEENKKKSYLNNIKKTKIFINTCEKNGVDNFIYLSSSNIYKEKNINEVLLETSKKYPKNFYGKNKLHIENYLKNKSFKNLIILRLFNIIGILNKKFKVFKFKKNDHQRLIFKILQNIKQNKETTIYYTQRNNKKIFPGRDFVFILDLIKIVEKIIRILKIKKNIFETFNVASGYSTSICKIVSLFKKKYKEKFKINYVKISKKELIYTKGSNKKLFKFLNFIPKTNLRNIVKTHYE